MGIVIKLRARRHHGRASTEQSLLTCFACNSARTAKVTPFKPRTSAEPTSGTQYSAGMLPRCDHLRTADAVRPVPMSSATAANEGHKAKRDRTESTIEKSLGQNVLFVKVNMSHDCELPFGNPEDMVKDVAASEFKRQFIARTKLAREAAGRTQEEMATILGIDQGKYKQYEKRTPLPHRYLERFCLGAHIDLDWLVKGKGRAPRAARLKAVV